jgi:uncharacterized protein YbjT (DUF2867 family)
MRILVTGASGFAGAQLIPRLLAEDHQIRALAREVTRVRAPVEVVRGDVVSGEGLEHALDGIEVAYYLIHSMERSHEQESFAARERIGAERFAGAAAAAGVRRIVYLGGLVPRRGAASRHLASRQAVERILMDAVAGSVALRASIVIGARSRSFRLLVRLIERMPVLALPAWRRFRTRPIDARDVTELLARAAAAPAVAGKSLDIAGPETLSYGKMIERIAELMLLRRTVIGLDFSLTGVTARVAAAIAEEDPELIVPLMEGLEGDLLPADERAAQLLEVELHSFDAAVERALREWESTERLTAR